jgi:hypothetical protein
VFGNPPWAGKSANRERLEPLLDDFRRDANGEPLRERKIGVLSDDYVRFWRWACELARTSEAGAVVALVTNASFLDGPVHRGMRAAMAGWFARIDVLDLGGSSLIARTGERDENVFGVRPSVAVTLAIRPPRHEDRARVRYAALRGTREHKLATLSERAFDDLAPRSIGSDGRWIATTRTASAYERWPSIAELVPFHREGLQTNRDAFCVDEDREKLLARLETFAAGEPGPFPGRAHEASPHYDPDKAREALRRALGDPASVIRVAYRPLMPRWMAVAPRICHRPRPDLLAAMRVSTFALLTVRKDRGQREWAHFGAARDPVDNCFLSARSSCRTRAFPTHAPDGTPNVDAVRLAELVERLSYLPSSLDLLHYALCVLASPRYRQRFDAALRADYPRLPPPSSDASFAACVAAGARLANAFEKSAHGGDHVVVGHHRIASHDLAVAIANCAEHAGELPDVG